ncbi:uncharacterized protein ASPGLDRAFT_80046 [Aspergillus glaucus CBS 516.65]|uniref:Uncharacterized protein n=1 Tax=Aspergillus glaucus CBS 516.65 TaxID=1160497 RepID=A0A1L9VTD9_ASPGL|nr:hypothetical protein ASPGLDRAFT_80046 [Aspergillus glaucus CBS 516.65]OJJ87164.1 hypothetical protein ASPGLDRAFT_80046 [Aspergillus glaucus CBS 516.65]
MVENRSLGLVLCSLLPFLDRLENLLVGPVFINLGRKSGLANWDSPEVIPKLESPPLRAQKRPGYPEKYSPCNKTVSDLQDRDLLALQSRIEFLLKNFADGCSSPHAPTFTWIQTGHGLVNVPSKAVSKFAQFYSCLPLFANEPSWRLKSSLVVGFPWIPRLAARRLDIFPRTNMQEDKYLQYLPQTWTMCNSLHEGALEPDLMWEMMIIAMLNYQADEFLEAVVDEHMMDQLDAVRALVERLCADANGESLFSDVDGNGNGNGETTPKSNGIYEKPVSLNGDVPGMDYGEPVLRRFITYILTHPAAIHSPPSVQRTLRRELKDFILAHITHAEDNARFLSQSIAADRTTQFATPCSYYYSWLLDRQIRWAGIQGSPPERYLAEDMCRHLATMCRQYNDYGSIVRDRAEKNLNSVIFPEFCEEGAEKKAGANLKTVARVEQKLKDNLMWVAEYERECCVTALGRLENETRLDTRTKRIPRMFVDVVDSYGQIYVARDIASRMR